MISVIIPYYNPDGDALTERLLYRAVGSVIDSLDGHCQYQVIVVDDGSFRIATGLPVHFTGKPVHLECARHGCLGAARNRGLELAQGTLVSFLDADDMYFPEGFRQCVQEMESSDAHALAFRHQDFYDETTLMKAMSSGESVDFHPIITGDRYMADGNLFASSCMYILRKEFLTENNLKFIEGQTAEDEEFTPRMLTLCHKLKTTDGNVYAYCHREGSITHTETPLKLSARISNAQLALRNLEIFRSTRPELPHAGLDRKITMLRIDILRLKVRRLISRIKKS